MKNCASSSRCNAFMMPNSAFGNSSVYGNSLPHEKWIPSINEVQKSLVKLSILLQIPAPSQGPNYEAIVLTRPEGILFLASLMMPHACKFTCILQEFYSNFFLQHLPSILKIIFQYPFFHLHIYSQCCFSY